MHGHAERAVLFIMVYRKLGKTGADISVIGLGAEHLEHVEYSIVDEVVGEALEQGINYVDLFMASPGVRDNFGKVLKGRRDKMMVCGHIGACMKDGQYYRSRETAINREYYEDILKRTKSDYMDVAMIHYVDTLEDAERVMAPGGALELACDYKKQGKARFIGLSSHNPSAALKLIGSGKIEVLMFSVNPVHDVLGDSELDDVFAESGEIYKSAAEGINPLREKLYATCAREGVGIVTMKTYMGGWMFKPNNFGLNLTPEQCIHYALSRPGVAAVLPGCRTAAEVKAAAAYLSAGAAERDYAGALSESNLWNKRSECMYCNHCLPCPVGIDIAETTRLRDIAQNGMTEALKARYNSLPATASSCIECRACETNCPFGIEITENIREAAALFE